MAKAIMRKREGKILFEEDLHQNIVKMFSYIDEALAEMNQNLANEYADIDVDKAYTFERKINEYRNELKKNHLIDIKEKKYKYKVGVLYNELFSTAEKLGDYIINTAESIHGSKVG